MIRSFILNNYMSKEFLKVVLNMTLAFFCMGFVLNLFEEINFFKDFDVGIELPIIVSLLFVPSLIYNMFPFIILFSGIWFFLKIKKTDEITGMQVAGRSNFSIIIIPSFLSILLGIFFITSLNPITSALVTKYENIKGSYDFDKEYLAAVTVNGIWIREKRDENNSIIRSSSLNNEKLMDVTIYQFNKFDDFVRRIEAEVADIKTSKWILIDAKVFNDEGSKLYENVKNFYYESIYDVHKIKALYSNLDTVSFWNIKNEIKILEDRGYSTREMEARLQRSFAFPLFLLSMLLLSAVFTLGMQFRENNWTYAFIAIITTVIVYFFNDFSAVLGKTEKLPIEVSVWMPIVIIFHIIYPL